MTTLNGKRALVTGASRGIGKAIALALAAEGADVVITYERSREKAEAVVAQIKATGRNAFALQADSADAQAVKNSVDQAAEALGGLDILVNNAGIFQYGTLETLDLATLDAVIDVNIKSVILASQAALAHLPDGGRIINLGSCLAEQVPAAGLSIYSMSKSALIAFTQGLARDLGPRGITVNIVHPGPTDTDMNPADSEKAAASKAGIALGHYGTSEDVAAAVTFLASPGAKQITGAGLLVDGGVNA
ncbi:SDR family NAD(P)-dependent oxidoreductase [Pseudomonas sp. BIGb0164]|uniref:SDR family NAD(P)-dependent oxidoreductase n=1 Tax=Pseudomonas sp. BIGb0164 TaxID=2940605 RepID=UPI002169E68C|nr:3-oxoacyl-ACP reductase family protein [Pseudomonas sp. BIGb0164]MCS4249989.1 NAD(P)-dependent dehydrogenase (short-subunit alcohol dehydrogenase family) [Pseudomonas sp. BIGb0164]